MPSEPFVHAHGSDANEIIYAVDFFLAEGIHLAKADQQFSNVLELVLLFVSQDMAQDGT